MYTWIITGPPLLTGINVNHNVDKWLRYIQYKVWDEITYPSPYVNAAGVWNNFLNIFLNECKTRDIKKI